MRLTLEVPKHHPQAKQFQPIEINVLWVQEIDPPQGQAPITWLLLTSLPIEQVQDAWQCVRWYSYRWLIVGEAFPQGTLSFHAQTRLSDSSVAVIQWDSFGKCVSNLLNYCESNFVVDLSSSIAA